MGGHQDRIHSKFIEYRRTDHTIDVSTDFIPDFPHSVDPQSPAVELHAL